MCRAFQDRTPRPDPAVYCEGYDGYRQFWNIPLTPLARWIKEHSD